MIVGFTNSDESVSLYFFRKSLSPAVPRRAGGHCNHVLHNMGIKSAQKIHAFTFFNCNIPKFAFALQSRRCKL